MRIGHGYDVHRFAEGDFITLGGVRIAHLRAAGSFRRRRAAARLSDALLGAAALGDIGKHFPDTDPQFKGADSRVLLRHVVA
jgi:2-C-methyl-D-erythritol 2,4-cyclodiphosphate synthase